MNTTIKLTKGEWNILKDFVDREVENVKMFAMDNVVAYPAVEPNWERDLYSLQKKLI